MTRNGKAITAIALIGLVAVGTIALIRDDHGKKQPALALPAVPANELKAPSLNPNGVEIRGASQRERALLGELLKRVPADEIKTISFVHNDQRNKRTLIFKGPSTTRAEWEQEILGSLFVFQARRAKSGGIPINNLVTVGSAGSPQLNPIDADAVDADALSRALARSLAGTDARIVAMKMFRPIGALPALIVEVPDAAQFVKHNLKNLRSQFQLDVEGYYLLVFDSHKRRAYEEAFANRLGTGSTDISPWLQGCDPEIALNKAVRPLPCPAK